MINTIDVQIRKDDNYIIFYRDNGVRAYKIYNHNRVDDLVYHLKHDDRFETNLAYGLTGDGALIWFDRVYY